MSGSFFRAFSNCCFFRFALFIGSRRGIGWVKVSFSCVLPGRFKLRYKPLFGGIGIGGSGAGRMGLGDSGTGGWVWVAQVQAG